MDQVIEVGLSLATGGDFHMAMDSCLGLPCGQVVQRVERLLPRRRHLRPAPLGRVLPCARHRLETLRRRLCYRFATAVRGQRLGTSRTASRCAAGDTRCSNLVAAKAGTFRGFPAVPPPRSAFNRTPCRLYRIGGVQNRMSVRPPGQPRSDAIRSGGVWRPPKASVLDPAAGLPAFCDSLLDISSPIKSRWLSQPKLRKLPEN